MTRATRDTSRAAYGTTLRRATDLQKRVLNYLRLRGTEGATDEEGATATNLRQYTYAPRRGELLRLGVVVDSGKRRPTSSGATAIVWVVRDAQAGSVSPWARYRCAGCGWTDLEPKALHDAEGVKCPKCGKSVEIEAPQIQP